MEIDINFESAMPQLENFSALRNIVSEKIILETNLKTEEYRLNPPETPESPIQPDFSKKTELDFKENANAMEDIEISEEPPADSRVATIRLVEVGSDAEMDGVADDTTSFSVEYFHEKSLVELARYSWRGSSKNQRFLKGCLWAPDGTCVLTAVNGDGMHVVELPRDLYSVQKVNDERPLDVLHSAVHVKEAGVLYDLAWYPFMNSTDPATCCWLASRQHEPIQMWDAFNGELRCTYRGYNAVDEVESALSVAFSSDGLTVIGGYKKTMKLFQTNVPGRDYTSLQIKSPASALAVGNTNNLAVGSWTGIVSMYDMRHLKHDVIDQFECHTGGITFLKFLYGDTYLVSGARKDNKLLMWDVRNSSKPVLELSRVVDTNQRIYFDVSEDGKWLVSGDTNGFVHGWDICDKTEAKGFKFPVHRDCCNGVSIHPSRPILATSSGQHHFPQMIEMQETEENKHTNEMPKKAPRENSLIFWWSGPTGASNENVD